MDIKNIAEEVKNRILDYLPEEFENAKVSINIVNKQEGVKHGITVLKPDDIMAPTVYVDDFYKDSISLEEVLLQIAEVIEANYVHEQSKVIESVGFDISKYETVKDKLFPIMLNKDVNSEYLEGFNYKTINDIAIIAAVNIPEFYGRDAHAKVTKIMQETWNCDTEQMISDAISNMKLEKCVLLEVTTKFLQNIDVDVLGYDSINNKSMFQLKSKDFEFGANAILSIQVQDRLNNLFPEGFFIIPSSISECLIISKEISNKETLKEMLNEINDNPDLMPRTQILSYNVYDDIDIKNGKFIPVESVVEEKIEIDEEIEL